MRGSRKSCQRGSNATLRAFFFFWGGGGGLVGGFERVDQKDQNTTKSAPSSANNECWFGIFVMYQYC